MVTSLHKSLISKMTAAETAIWQRVSQNIWGVWGVHPEKMINEMRFGTFSAILLIHYE